jgi:hypothetical protein
VEHDGNFIVVLVVTVTSRLDPVLDQFSRNAF